MYRTIQDPRLDDLKSKVDAIKRQLPEGVEGPSIPTVCQCLDCTTTIMADKFDKWKVCPVCQSKWESKPVRPQYIPRWAWDRWKDEPPAGVLYSTLPRRPRIKIEYRVEGYHDWLDTELRPRSRANAMDCWTHEMECAAKSRMPIHYRLMYNGRVACARTVGG